MRHQLPLLVLALCVDYVIGWGHLGHYVTAIIADEQLDEETRELTHVLLEGRSISDVASWPDQVKHEGKWMWTSSLHFCDTSGEKCSITYKRDCHNQYNHTGNCVLAAIHNYTIALQSLRPSNARLGPPRPQALTLANERRSYGEKFNPHQLDQRQLLTFLVHYVGDLHQPMHVGRRSDLGGNKINVVFEGRKTELHAVWDNMVLDRRLAKDFGKDQKLYATYLTAKAQNVTAQDSLNNKCTDHSIRCLVAWANESARASCQHAYKGVEAGMALGDEYYERVLPVIEDRLMLGGLRLAKLIKAVLA